MPQRLRVALVAFGLLLAPVGCSAAVPAPSPSEPSVPSSAPPLPSALPSAPRPGTTGASGRERLVSSVDAIRRALASAQPGDTITVAEGEYLFRPRLEASASGTADRPITLRATRGAVLRTRDSSGDYGLWITGDHWVVSGLTVAHASKGIVLDGSVGTVIEGVDVYDTGQEGVHFRSCSSDGVLRSSSVHDTGRRSPQYGEGVVVGSARSNWSRFACRDAREGPALGDNPLGDKTERVLIEDNTFTDVPAEGADLKEGTDSGTLRGNVFRPVGSSGENSADSAVDVKGNGWAVERNTVLEPEASYDGTRTASAFTDGFQTHTVAPGYGARNTFTDNTVNGTIPGFGVGLYPAADNRVSCGNRAPGAAKGLVGDGGRAVACQP